MPYKKNQRLEIEWLDVHTNATWLSEAEARSVPPEVYCKTIGYFLQEDDTFIWLSSMVSTRQRKGERDRIIIPKGMITKTRKLTPLRRTKNGKK